MLGPLTWHRELQGQTESTEEGQVWGRHKGTNVVQMYPFQGSLGQLSFQPLLFHKADLGSVWDI